MDTFRLILFRLKEFFLFEKKVLLKIIIIGFLAYWLVWEVSGLKVFLYKYFYGSPDSSAPIENSEVMEDYEDYNPNALVKLNGHVAYKNFLKKYAVAGTFVSHASNEDFVDRNFASLDRKSKKAYNEVSPDNLTVVFGANVKGALMFCDFEQELNNTYVKCPNSFKQEGTQLNNYHIIPATGSLARVVSILPKKAEKEIYLEGLLLDWDIAESNENPKDLRFKTALVSGQTVSGKDGGAFKKNFQLYLTRMIYDGYEFK